MKTRLLESEEPTKHKARNRALWFAYYLASASDCDNLQFWTTENSLRYLFYSTNCMGFTTVVWKKPCFPFKNASLFRLPTHYHAVHLLKKEKVSQRVTFRLVFQPAVYSSSSNQVEHLVQKKQCGMSTHVEFNWFKDRVLHAVNSAIWLGARDI